MRRPVTCAVLALAAVLLRPAGAAEDRPTAPPGTPHLISRSTPENPMKIRLTINGKAVIARLNDTATARELAAQLPLTLPLEDYAATEKITYLPKKLSTAGAPAGFDPSVGDITYYAPWGNLAIFYKDFGYSQGLISLGQIETGLDVLEVQGPAEVVIERID